MAVETLGVRFCNSKSFKIIPSCSRCNATSSFPCKVTEKTDDMYGNLQILGVEKIWDDDELPILLRKNNSDLMSINRGVQRAQEVKPYCWNIAKRVVLE